jgi:hypothetical protein
MKKFRQILLSKWYSAGALITGIMLLLMCWQKVVLDGSANGYVLLGIVSLFLIISGLVPFLTVRLPLILEGKTLSDTKVDEMTLLLNYRASHVTSGLMLVFPILYEACLSLFPNLTALDAIKNITFFNVFLIFVAEPLLRRYYARKGVN